jgi:5-methylcytosine-specific restriction endonuclease McrA
MEPIDPILHLSQIEEIEKQLKPKKNSYRYFVIEYLKLNAGKYVGVSDVQAYCSQQKLACDGKSFGDPSRGFEILRRDVLPLQWDEYKSGNRLFVRFNPLKKEAFITEIAEAHKHRSDGFSKETINAKLQECGYKCALTGLPQSEGKLAADHFLPKEKGGKSEPQNCVILNKILNEQKNNLPPVEWFTKSLLTNFINLTQSAGMDLESVKSQLISFIQAFPSKA